MENQWATASQESRPGEDLPSELNRYIPERQLGRGAFGHVILAEDSVLKRRVAIKLLTHEDADPAAAANFLNEARLLARMDHPGIMPVYDALETLDGRFCIISRFVDGPTLAAWLREKAVSRHDTAAIISAVCEALDHAHRQGVVHRDVKPANIILTAAHKPVLLDFGIARLWENFPLSGRVCGTPAYMSPEQARGEDHLVDGRSDIFSVGAVLYEMLTGQRAWDVSTPADLLRRVAAGDLIPPRRVDASIPREIERICLKALQSRPRDRFGTCQDMAQDLRAWMTADSQTVVVSTTARMAVPSPDGHTPLQSSSLLPAAIVPMIPRGLKAYDESDADFFLNLLPGPRDRNGLPESVRFWRQRLEITDDSAARVCTLYGPSGSGKSSFLRAALIPLLERHVHVVKMDAADASMGNRLLYAVRSRFPDTPSSLDAAGLLLAIRQGAVLPRGQKLLLVVDQTEQWLRTREKHKNDPERPDDLTAMLRQCDGLRVQALLVVRDDFWRGLTLLLEEANTAAGPENSALIDLFDMRHAGRVLEMAGRALRTLPEDPAVALPPESQVFLREAVAALAEHGQVSPARLALFTQMFRTRPWTSEALREIGGAERFGTAFLDDAFLGAGATAQHRLHERAARAVLSSMLPESGDVREAPVPESKLQAASGYSDRPRLFSELLQMLDRDLRLITPVEQEPGANTQSEGTWQLAHDQLVPALRDWLHLRQAATLRGRAAIRLKERAAEYRLRPTSRTTSGVAEWLRFRFLTNRRRWTDGERKFMKKGRRRAVMAGVCALGAACGVWFGFGELRKSQARSAARAIVTAPPGEIVMLTKEMSGLGPWLVPELKGYASKPSESPEASKAALALLALGAGDAGRVADTMLAASPAEFAAACDAYRYSGRNPPVEMFQHITQDSSISTSRRLRALAGLTSLAPSFVPSTVGEDPAKWLVLSGSDAPLWAAMLKPISGDIDRGLRSEITALAERPIHAREACAALIALHTGKPETLANLARFIPVDHLVLLRDALRDEGTAALKALRDVLSNTASPPPKATAATPEEREIYQFRAHAATLLASLAEVPETGGFSLRRTPDRTERTLFTLACSAAGVSPSFLTTWLRKEGDPGVRFALILALSAYRPGDFSDYELTEFLEWLRNAWQSDPDGGCHSAMRWLMARWDLSTVADSMDKATVRTPEPKPGFTWWVTPSGVDMRIVALESGDRTAVAAMEYAVPLSKGDTGVSFGKLPVADAAWTDAAFLCISQAVEEGIPEEEWVYSGTVDEITVADEHLQKRGFRLCTVEEWQAAASAGTNSVTEAGAFPEFLLLSAWTVENARNMLHLGGMLRPSDAGVFDAFGNVAEWTDDFDDISKTGILTGEEFSETPAFILTAPLRRYGQKSRVGFQLNFGFRLARTVESVH